jgi:O-antigen ligase
VSIAINPIREAAFVVAHEETRSVARPMYGPRLIAISILIAAPLGFGSTSVRAGIVLTVFAWVALLCWFAESLRFGQIQWQSSAVMLPVLGLLAFSAVHWALPISADPVASQLEWLRWVGIIALAFTAAEVFMTAKQLRRLCVTLALAGLAVALFAIVQYLTSNGKIYWLVEATQGGWIFGPYVNRNHFAGLMELWLPLALGLALMPENPFLRRWLWCLVAVVMAVAVFLSGSRGGVLAIGLEVLLIAFAAAALRGRRAAVGLGIAVALAVTVAAVLSRGDIVARYQQTLSLPQVQQEEAAAYRIQAWKGTLGIFMRYPVIGAGLDTFATHFPGIRSFSTDKIWTHAHNDFLQFAAELGLIGVALAGWILFVGSKTAWQNIQRTLGTSSGALLIGMACACAGFMVHGWLDFNFHVPANAANFAVLGAVLTRPGWDED